MTLPQSAGVIATLILLVVIVFQVLLAAGLPLGRAAWGGQYRVLPPRLRWGSVAAALVLGAAAWVILARANQVAPSAEPVAVQVATWVFGGVFLLNTLGKVVSKSPLERSVMAPATLLLAACFLYVALAWEG